MKPARIKSYADTAITALNLLIEEASKQSDTAMKLPKIPIDCTDALLDKTFTKLIVHIQGEFHTSISFGYWDAGEFGVNGWLGEGEKITHYTPLPDFEEVQESESTLLQDTYFSGIEFPEIERR